MKTTITLLFFVIFSKITFSQISNTSFAPKVDFASGVGNTSNPVGIKTADLDNDGKNDIIVGNQGAATVSVFRNTSTLNNISLSSKLDLITSNIVSFVGTTDFNGDGKIDIVLCSAISGAGISIFKNTTTSIGNITFANRQDFTCEIGYYNIDMKDVDGDLKPDILVTNSVASSFSIFRNTSTTSTISFAIRIDQVCGSDPSSVAILDMDGDGKNDLVITSYKPSQLEIYKNTTTSIGNPTFTFISSTNVGSYPHFIKSADLDNDGKIDFVTGNLYGHNISIIKNTSTLGSLSVQNSVNLTSGINISNCQGINLNDFDNDNKIDIMVCNRGNNTISLFKNISTNGVLNTNSFANQVLFLVNSQPIDNYSDDLNGDGKIDLLVSNNGSNSISIFKNQMVFTNTENIYLNTNVNILPVPMHDELNINIVNNEKIELVSIYNINGKLILQVNNQANIDVSGLNSGIYIINIKSENQTFTRKIIKH